MADSEVRVGKVSSVNYDAGMVRVTYHDKDDSVTSEFPVLTNNDEYRMPQIGDSVLVAHLSNGSSRGAILGTLWNQKHIPSEAGSSLYRKELSRKKDAAYIRYSDETGEYLVKMANLHLNGVNKTVLDGPKLEIAANISILLQSEQMHIDMSELLVTGCEGGTVNASVKADTVILQEENFLESVIKKAVMEFIENMEIKAGTSIEMKSGKQTEISADSGLKFSGKESVEISTEGDLKLADGGYETTLTEIMERLEALEGR